MSDDPTRVLIADDHVHFREGLRALLQSEPDFELAGEACDGDEAIDLAAVLQPDVVLMDLHMPGTGGIEATRRILDTSPHISILVVSMIEDDDSVFAAMQSGARGYLLKGARKAEMLRAMRAVAAGEAIFGPEIARRLIRYFSAQDSEAVPEMFPELTEREREILNFLADHHSNPEIARRLQLSPKDRSQPRLQHLHQAPGAGPSRSDHACSSGRNGTEQSEPTGRQLAESERG